MLDKQWFQTYNTQITMSAMCKAAASQAHVRALPKVIIDCCGLLLAKLCWLYHVNLKYLKKKINCIYINVTVFQFCYYIEPVNLCVCGA